MSPVARFCVFVGSPNHHAVTLSFPFFFEPGFVFFLLFAFFVFGSKEKVKEKPGKDEKKSKVRPVFLGVVGEGGGLVWVIKGGVKPPGILEIEVFWYFSWLSISVQTLHQLVRLVLMIRYTPKVYFFPGAYFQIPCHNKSSVFPYNLRFFEFFLGFLNVTHLICAGRTPVRRSVTVLQSTNSERCDALKVKNV